MAKTRVALIGLDYNTLAVGQAVRNLLKDVEILGHDRDRDTMKQVEMAKMVDKCEWNIPNITEGAAAIFIGSPANDYDVVFKAIAPDALPKTIVASVSSFHSPALKAANQWLPRDAAFFSTSIVIHPDRVLPTEPWPNAQTVKNAIWTIAPRAGAAPNMVDIFTGLVSEVGASPMFVDPTERDGMAVSVDVMPGVLGSMLLRAVSNDPTWRDRQWVAGAAFGQAVAGADDADKQATLLMQQPETVAYWLNQIMLQCMALRDAVSAHDEKAVKQMLSESKARREQWLADWRKGRDDGRQPIERKNALMSMFLGERMSSKLSGKK